MTACLRGSWRVLFLTGLASSVLLVWGAALAADPMCSGTLQPPFRAMAQNNSQVLNWKRNTQNQYVARGYVQGKIVKIYPDRNDHEHFAIQIGTGRNDILEVVYSKHFGELPALQVGSNVVACGDYITSRAQAGHYPPSPAGAIIHWVHASDSPRHPSGFLIVDNVLYGQFQGRGRRPSE